MIAQWIVVGIILTACVAYLGRTAWRMLRGKSTGCGCSDCPAGNRTKAAK